MRNTMIPKYQQLVNKINANVQFQYPSGLIPDSEPTRLHKSHNPSQRWNNPAVMISKAINNGNMILGISHPDGSYEVLEYELNN